MQSQGHLYGRSDRAWSPWLRVVWLGAACLLFLVTGAFGQGVSGRLQGTIQDGTGAVISGASVSITNLDTGVVVKATSDGNGEYVANLLPPGTYKVEVQAQGFRTTVSNGNVVTVDSVTRVDVALQLGTTNETCR